MIKYLLIIFLVFFAVKGIASIPAIGSLDYILQAPPTSENSLSLFTYLNTLYNRWNTLQVTTQEPNGNLTANYGNIVIYYDGTHYFLAIEINAPSGTSWKGVQLGSV